MSEPAASPAGNAPPPADNPPPPHNPPPRTLITYRDAAREAIKEAILQDQRVFLLGEDVGAYGGTFGVTRGLLEELGPDRVRDTPLSESAFVGAGIGAAIGGLRPIVEVMTVNFMLLALDQIINNAATLSHMSGGQICVPLVIRTCTGAGRQVAAQHSHTFDGWLSHIPGLKLLSPASIQDARWMLKGALADPNPVLIFEHAMLYNTEGELPQGGDEVDIEHAGIRRRGRDLTIVAYGGAVQTALTAAEQLSGEGIDAEVIDLRVLRPLDERTVTDSVSATRRAVMVEEGWRSAGAAAEVSARITERCFYDLDAPVARVCGVEVPMPYAKHLEEAALPQPGDVVTAARKVLGESGSER